MNTVISVRIDKQIKAEAQAVAESVGLKLGTLINAYLRQVVFTRRIELFAPEQMTEKMEKMIAGIETEMKAGGVSRKFDNVDDFLADLSDV